MADKQIPLAGGERQERQRRHRRTGHVSSRPIIPQLGNRTKRSNAVARALGLYAPFGRDLDRATDTEGEA